MVVHAIAIVVAIKVLYSALVFISVCKITN